MRITVVTPTHIASGLIDEAIASVPRHPGGAVEHIVVHDLAPGDAAALAARHPQLLLLAGSGDGPTEAAARGFAAATGDFVIQLNSDDRLTPEAFVRLAECATQRPEVEVWTGGARIFRVDDGREITVRRIVSRAATALNLANALDDVGLMTARFIRRDVFARIGNLDRRFAAASDREFMLRAVLAGIIEEGLGVVVSEMRQHPGSRTLGGTAAVPEYLTAHLALADLRLADTGLAKSTRRAIRNWRARTALALAVYQARTGALRAAAQTLGEAARRDHLWWLRAGTVVAVLYRRRRG